MKQIRYVVVIDKPDEWSLAELDAYLRHLTPLIKSADRDLTEKHGAKLDKSADDQRKADAPVMTVADLITELAKLDKSGYRVDVRCDALQDGHDSEDRDVIGVLSVIDDRRQDFGGWVTLELDES